MHRFSIYHTFNFDHWCLMVSQLIFQGCVNSWRFSRHIPHCCFWLNWIYIAEIFLVLRVVPCVMGLLEDPTFYISFTVINFWCFFIYGSWITLLPVIFVIISCVIITLLIIPWIIKIYVRPEISSPFDLSVSCTKIWKSLIHSLKRLKQGAIFRKYNRR